MKIKHLIIIFVLLAMTGCSFQEAADALGNMFGANTPDGELSPASTLFGTLGPVLPGGLGVGLVALCKMVHSGFKFKQAIYESTSHAIESGSLSNANTVEEVKQALSHAQSLHDDSKLLMKSYQRHKDGGIIKKIMG